MCAKASKSPDTRLETKSSYQHYAVNESLNDSVNESVKEKREWKCECKFISFVTIKCSVLQIKDWLIDALIDWMNSKTVQYFVVHIPKCLQL